MFFVEGIDIPNAGGGLRKAVLAAVMQSFSCLCALIFPFCPSVVSWSFWMCISVVTYCAIFPRMLYKRKRYLDECKELEKDSHAVEREDMDRIRFSYILSLVCTVIWTSFVILYFSNMAAHRLLPEDHVLRQMSLAMLVDTAFDVMAKAIYLKLRGCPLRSV